MRVLHVSSSDTFGGAAKSAMRLHCALAENGVDSIFFAGEKTKSVRGVIGFRFGYFKRRLLAVIDNSLLLIYRKRTRNYTFTNNWFWFSGLVREINKVKPDVVHFHWIGKGLIRIEDLGKIKVPIVWTMHDNYPFTGGCHIVNNCPKYVSMCGACPQLNSEHMRDRSNKNFKRKLKVYRRSKIAFIAPSNWMLELARKSALLKDYPVINIPNPISEKDFFPLDKSFAKRAVGFGTNEKLIVFGAVNATSDINKGFNDLAAALKRLAVKTPVRICVFGADGPENDLGMEYDPVYVGYLNDNISKRILYSAADVVVVPSRVENLSNVIMEALACGTPVVAFGTGGNADLIDHKISGFLARQGDVDDLAGGMQWVLENAQYQSLCDEARVKVQKKFESDMIAGKHIALYQSIISGR